MSDSKGSQSSMKKTGKIAWFWNYLQFILEFLIEPIVITLLWDLYLPQTSLIFRLFTQDNIFASIRYLITHLGFIIREPEVVTVPKYTYYIGISGVYYLLDIITWGNYPREYLYYFILFTGSPAIVEFILKQNLNFLDKLEQLRRRLTNYLACLALSKVVNLVCVQTLQMDNPDISTDELQKTILMQDTKYIWEFVKVFAVTSIIKYLKTKKDYRMYGKIIKMLYDWGTIIQLPKYHKSMIVDEKTLHPRETISSIIKERKWHYFYDPTVLNLILRIYREQDGDFMDQCLADLKRRILQFFTLWSLARIAPIPVLALLFRIRDRFPRNLIIPVIDLGLLILFPGRYILISLFSEFCYYLNNPATRHLISQTGFYVQVIREVLCHINKYNWFMTLAPGVVYWVSRVNPYGLIILPFITRYNFIYIWLVIFGLFSGYLFSHLVVLVIILYLLVNLHDWNQVKERPEFAMNMVSSYWGGNIGSIPRSTIHASMSPRVLKKL